MCADLRKYPSLKEKFLKTDVLSTDAVFKTRDIIWYTESSGVSTNITSADFGSLAFGVHEPRTDRQEFFTFDPTSISNFATTGIVYVTRGLKPGADYVTSIPGLKFNHPTGSKVLLYTNAPAFYNDFLNKDNDETISETWTFTQQVLLNGGADAGGQKIVNMANPTVPQDAATKFYVDNVAIAGAPNADEVTKGIVQLATNAQMGTGTSVGSTGARLSPPNDQLVKVSSGAADQNKIPVLNAAGKLADGFQSVDSPRTWTTIQTFPPADLQINAAPTAANDAANKAYVDASVEIAFETSIAGENITAGQAIGISQTTSTLGAGTGADDAAVGALAWTNPGNITADDASYATCALFPGTTHYLKGTNFGFAIPVGATIIGIRALIKRKTTGVTMVDNIVSIVKSSGAIGATNKASPDFWEAVDTNKYYGNATDLWGETWTPADINSVNFGFVLSATTAAAVTASVNFFQLSVYYAIDGKVFKVIASSDSVYKFVGVALDTVLSGASIRYVRPGGVVTGLSGLSVGANYFVTDVSGVIGTVPGTNYAKIGQAIESTKLRVIEPKFIKTGVQNFVATGSFFQTVGFYPAKITIWGSGAVGGNSSILSYSDEVQGEIPTSLVGGDTTFGARSWHTQIGAGFFTGNANTKSPDGFILTCTVSAVANGSENVWWTAESL